MFVVCTLLILTLTTVRDCSQKYQKSLKSNLNPVEKCTKWQVLCHLISNLLQSDFSVEFVHKVRYTKTDSDFPVNRSTLKPRYTDIVLCFILVNFLPAEIELFSLMQVYKYNIITLADTLHYILFCFTENRFGRIYKCILTLVRVLLMDTTYVLQYEV